MIPVKTQNVNLSLLHGETIHRERLAKQFRLAPCSSDHGVGSDFLHANAVEVAGILLPARAAWTQANTEAIFAKQRSIPGEGRAS